MKQLRIGDTLITDDGMVVLETIDTQSDNPTTQLYNFILDGDRTYYADGYLVHNKDACGSGGTCNPGWVCGSVGMEIIPYPPYDTGTCVRWDHYDCASKAKADCSPSKKCAWINGG
ncbi:MAG: hypothetical protein H6766_01245 [Candidatus Peribacteria bacterium]|nr:MAG: hypothetical protein H6766_01245 [Candidatus Peribacteria bacterium]